MNAFHKTTWSQVKAGDTVLMAWKKLDRIVEAEIKSCRPTYDPDGMVVLFDVDTLHYGQTFTPDETAYVQSRL